MPVDAQTPRARQDGLIVQHQLDETLVYDSTNHHAHCLNRLAAAVWSHCDGRRDAVELADLLHYRLDLPNDAAVIDVALDELNEAKLLEGYTPKPLGSRLSRRDLGLKFGIALLMTPLVTSIRTQTAAAAASPPVRGGPGHRAATMNPAGLPTTVHPGTTIALSQTNPRSTTGNPLIK